MATDLSLSGAADRTIIVMAAINGARRTKRDHPNLPITAEEIAQETARCVQAGAAVIHCHVRDGAGGHTLDPGIYRDALNAIKERSGDKVIVQITTETVGKYGPGDIISVTEAVKPEAVSVAIREICPDAASEPAAMRFFHWMQEAGIWPQFILHTPDDLKTLMRLRAAGGVPFAVPYVLFVLGAYGEHTVSHPDDLDPFTRALKPEMGALRWGLCAFGQNEAACIRRGLDFGGDLRVGFENNMVMPHGETARNTAELVRLASEAVLARGRRRMAVADIRAAIPGWLGVRQPETA